MFLSSLPQLPFGAAVADVAMMPFLIAHSRLAPPLWMWLVYEV
jgi:hypothetical protein